MAKLLTVRETAEATGLTDKAIRRRIEKGQLESVSRNGQRLVVQRSLIESGLIGDGGGSGSETQTTSKPKPIGEATDVGTLLAAIPEVAKIGEELGRYKALTETAESANRQLQEKVASQETELEAARQREADLKARVESLEREADRGGLWKRLRGGGD